MFNNIFNQIIILLIGVIAVTNTYANIEYFTSAAPSMYGEPLTKKIGITDDNEFYLKNVNYDVNEINKKNRGIGYIDGKINKETYAEYMINIKNFDKYSKDIDAHPLKGNKLNVLYQKNDKEVIKSIPFNFFVKNSDAKTIQSWFDQRINIISNSESHKMKTGFFINYSPIFKQGDFLIFKLSFVNNGDSDVQLLDIKEWKKNNFEKHKNYSVRLVLKSEYDYFNYYLTEDNIINMDKHKENLIIPKSGSLDLEFKMDKKELSDFYNFKNDNEEKNIVSYVNLNLKIISPIKIKGGFLYETNHYSFK